MTAFIVWILFGSVIIVAFPLQLLGLPGTWLLVGDAFLLRWLMGPDHISYRTVIILLIMALLAEVLEFMSAVQAPSTGPPVRGTAVAAIAGAFAGGLFGAPVLFGLGAIPGMVLGAWLAVFAVSLTGGATVSTASSAALGAMTGRLKGTALKLMMAVSMVAVIIISLVF